MDAVEEAWIDVFGIFCLCETVVGLFSIIGYCQLVLEVTLRATGGMAKKESCEGLTLVVMVVLLVVLVGSSHVSR